AMLPIQVEGGIIPSTPNVPPRRWRFTSWPAITYSGTPCWMAGESEVERGPALSRGVYAGAGTGTHRVLGTGDSALPDGAVITGAVGAIESFSVSPLGTSVLAVVHVERGAGTTESRVVRREVNGGSLA